MWRDPLDELIEDLEAALPPTTGRYEHLPRLEDLQAVISPILFGTEEEKERLLSDPNYQRLSDTVMRQLHESLSGSREPAACPENPRESKTRTENGHRPEGVDECTRPQSVARQLEQLNLICICGADEDGEHTLDCPLADESF
jgi:hypothetical protein